MVPVPGTGDVGLPGRLGAGGRGPSPEKPVQPAKALGLISPLTTEETQSEEPLEKTFPLSMEEAIG